MRPTQRLSGCACCHVHRRQFLSAGCAACVGASGLMSLAGRGLAADSGGKMRIRVVYALHAPQQARPDWPNIGFDFVPVMNEMNQALRQGCPGLEFVVSMATGPEEAEKILAEDQKGGVEGYIVCQLNCWNRVVQTLAKSGKPTLYTEMKYGGSGGFLVYTAGFLRAKSANVGFVGSSKLDDLVAAARCFDAVKKGGGVADFVAATARIRQQRTPAAGDMKVASDPVSLLSTSECLQKLKQSKILAVGGRGKASNYVLPGLGIEVIAVPFPEVDAAWKAADKDQAAAIADGWQKAAARVEAVNRTTLEQSAAMYLAQKAMLKKYGAEAITINCLGGFYGGHLHAYPCLGFHQLNNEGLVGACECDVRSAATMVALTTLTRGRPGFISDPVIDTASRQIIYAHCVASNKAFGPQGPANPFQILTHSEDRQGAAVRSILPVGYMTTTVELAAERKTILFHRGKAVANVPDDRACRTKLAAEPVGDIEKLFTEWDHWGWHRVTFYGDLKEPVFALADALGWKVLEEA